MAENSTLTSKDVIIAKVEAQKKKKTNLRRATDDDEAAKSNENRRDQVILNKFTMSGKKLTKCAVSPRDISTQSFVLLEDKFCSMRCRRKIKV